MIDADLPAGAAVFLDASVFIHNFAPNALFGPTATEFLERIENQEMSGITTTHIRYDGNRGQQSLEVRHHRIGLEDCGQRGSLRDSDAKLVIRSYPKLT